MKLYAIVFLISLVFLVGCQQEEKQLEMLNLTDNVVVGNGSEEELTKTLPEIANPASVFCEKQGYELEIRDEEDGQAGYCIFPDGVECEEWLFYREVCGTKYNKELEE